MKKRISSSVQRREEEALAKPTGMINHRRTVIGMFGFETRYILTFFDKMQGAMEFNKQIMIPHICVSIKPVNQDFTFAEIGG